MSLTEVNVEHLRCLEQAKLELHSHHNLIWGLNASGKTSLLEAIYLLGRGRSFRTRNSEKLIQRGREQLVVFGRTDSRHQNTLGIQVSRAEGTVAKVGGAFVQSLAELSTAFPVQVIEPGIHRWVEEGAYRRRRWMDWAVFHVEPGFIDSWSRYTRTLKQRNAALRTSHAQAHVWDAELARLGEQISEARRSWIERLQPDWRRLTSALLGFPVELTYAKGWSQDLSLEAALIASYERDRRVQMTHTGPHRADALLRVEGKLAREVLSRGQQKLVGIAMTLAPLRLIRDTRGVIPTLLLDDPAAELDRTRLAVFAEEIESLQCQLVVTALSPDFQPLGTPDRVFHVEQGRVLPV